MVHVAFSGNSHHHEPWKPNSLYDQSILVARILLLINNIKSNLIGSIATVSRLGMDKLYGRGICFDYSNKSPSLFIVFKILYVFPEIDSNCIVSSWSSVEIISSSSWKLLFPSGKETSQAGCWMPSNVCLLVIRCSEGVLKQNSDDATIEGSSWCSW